MDTRELELDTTTDDGEMAVVITEPTDEGNHPSIQAAFREVQIEENKE